MRSYVSRFLVIFVLVLLQATILEHVKIKDAKPDIVFILILYFGIKSGIYISQGMGFVGGFISDIAYSMYFGLNMFVYTLLGFISGLFHKKVYIDTFFGTFFYLLLGTLIKGILYFIIVYVIINEFSLDKASSYFANTVLIEMLMNALLAPFIFNILNKFNITTTD